MNIKISREQLLPALISTSSVVEKRQTLPILSNLLLKQKNGLLSITGSNLEVEVNKTLSGVGQDEGHVSCLHIYAGACAGTDQRVVDQCRRQRAATSRFRRHCPKTAGADDIVRQDKVARTRPVSSAPQVACLRRCETALTKR